jgi:prolyl-tRNA synthetase
MREQELKKEKEHLKGFAPEVAWITRYGTQSLKNDYAIRPTSEIIVNWYLKNSLLKSTKQLPLKISQWANVLRWEGDSSFPFVRTREFLWQEGHSSFKTQAEALQETEQIMDIYSKLYRELLAVPFIRGIKSKKETFAGALQTKTLECLISPVGKAIQACTAHHLGQNFSRMFQLSLEGLEGEFPYQNSWGITTRAIGVALMVHSDNVGVVLPPSIAPVQVSIIPCGFKRAENDLHAKIIQKCKQLHAEFTEIGIRSEVDDASEETPGFKFNKQEFNGIPLRIEIGPNELPPNALLTASKRTELKRIKIKSPIQVPQVLQEIQLEIYQKACKELATLVEGPAENLQDLQSIVSEKKHFALFEWCEQEHCEEAIGERVKGKIICIPNDYQTRNSNRKCLICKKEATVTGLFGNSF